MADVQKKKWLHIGGCCYGHVCFVSFCGFFFAQGGKANSWPPLHRTPPTHSTPRIHRQPRLREREKKTRTKQKTAGVVTTRTKHLRHVATCSSRVEEEKESEAWVTVTLKSKSVRVKKHLCMLKYVKAREKERARAKKENCKVLVLGE